MPQQLHMERMMHRSSVAVQGDSLASYALIKLIPGSDEGASLPLHLVLGIDVSGSMFEEDGTGKSRLKRVQEAVLAALPLLRPSDTLSIVAFANGAAVILPATSLTEREKIQAVLQKIDRTEVDPGGTTLDVALQTASDQLGSSESNVLQQVMILTDGETSNEQLCRDIAKTVSERKQRLCLIGIGTEWNASLIKELAGVAEGTWYYAEADKPEATAQVFQSEFAHLGSTTFSDVEIHIKPMKDVRIKRCRLVSPEIKELQLEKVDERHYMARIGTLTKDKPTRYVLDLSLPARPDGQFVLSQVEIKYQTMTGPGSTGAVPLQITYAANSPGYINAEVAKHIDEVHIYELNQNLQVALQDENATEARRLATAIEKKGELLGPQGQKKTKLARQALAELAGGAVSRKTMLALDDSSRLAEDLPVA